MFKKGWGGFFWISSLSYIVCKTWKRVQKRVGVSNPIIGPTQDLENITTDALDTFIRNTVAPMLHLVGSAAMSARDAKHGVVDPGLLVKGVHGLRIIDASVLVSNSFQLRDEVLISTEAGNTQYTHGCSGLCRWRERSGNF
jgi:hypothetical protein